MTRASTILLALFAAATARGAGGAPNVQATPAMIDALTGIDFPAKPSEMAAQKVQLDALLGASPVAELVAIADDDNTNAGVRLRAVRAIALYPSDEARAALTNEIALHGQSSSGVELLQLRAAVEALGLVGLPGDVDTLVPLLDKEDSRDIRAAAARALRDLGSPTAIAPLRARLTKETVEQVRFAISDALRVLSGTPP